MQQITDDILYGIPHLVSRSTRHDAVGMAAVVGRNAPDDKGDVMDFTKRVTTFYPGPPNHRRKPNK